MFDMVKPFHVLVTLVILVSSATAGVIWKFTPITYAEETRQMVVEIDDKGELKYWNSRRWEMKKACMDLRTQEWLCSDEDEIDYESILIEIKLLEEKLGIGKDGG